jgi:hypothetical protein
MAPKAEQRQLTRIAATEPAELARRWTGVNFSYPDYRGYKLALETAASFFFSSSYRKKTSSSGLFRG